MPLSDAFLFKFTTDLTHYTAEAFAVRCFDNRFWKAFHAFIKNKKLGHIDTESVAGGAKIFASPEMESDRDFMFRELEKSIQLHHTRCVMLFTHHDCGAYGGLARFGGDSAAELAFHREEHANARAVILTRFPDLVAGSYFISADEIIAFPQK
ncbi:MAG: hypothetical protein Q8Q94_01815 [bacterium]|nr:hypothetical protein [bacterium]MDZ4299300.1 carbonic anhydrase [Candidatus Sungbacteria bacterium]